MISIKKIENKFLYGIISESKASLHAFKPAISNGIKRGNESTGMMIYDCEVFPASAEVNVKIKV